MRSRTDSSRRAGSQAGDVPAPEASFQALPCPHLPPCAGCPLLPVPYPDQLEAKRREVVEALRPVLSSEDLVAPMAPSPRLRGYRNQVRLVFRRMARGGKDRVALGLYVPGTHRVVHIPRCPIQPSRLNGVARTVTKLAEELRIGVYDERQGRGVLRYLALRSDRSRHHVLVTIVVAEDPGRPLRVLAERLRAVHPEVVGVQVHRNPHHGNVMFAGRDGWTLGADHLQDQLGGFRVLVSSRSFLQVNHMQAEWIYQRLAAWLAPGAPATCEVVLDLYCGLGGIALHLAAPGRLVVGVEEVGEAVEDARRAAQANGVAGTRFVAAPVEAFLADPAAHGVDLAGRPLRAVVLNPPRGGVQPGVMESIAALAPEHIAYVSCRPATLARDLRLVGPGYAVEEVAPVDMIPLTRHVEAVCFLRRIR
jgi:23S rRNA (uracil1939-C5)-methyltransferase